MYYITDTEKRNRVYSALASRTREFRQRLSFGEWQVSGTSRSFAADITYEKGIIKLDISQQGNSDGSGLVMGCCCSSSCTAEFYNLDKTYNYDGKIMFVECGVKLSDDSFFYIPCGYYKVESPETDDDWRTVSLTAYDDIDRMGEKWTSNLTYPSTAYLVLKEITDKYGIELDFGSGVSSTLKSREITEAEALTLTSYTEREVCGFIAGLAGANARMNSVGSMRVAWYTEQPADYAVSIPANLQWQNGFKKTSESAFVINSVTSGIDDAVFTAGTGTGISFANPIITEAEITAIYEKYGGMSFQPCTCEWRGNPCLECGDIVTVTDRNSVEYTVYIANQDIDLTGGLSMSVTCPGGDADISFDTVDERTRAALNRQYTSLQQAIIEETNAINGAVGGYYEILDNDNDGNPDGWIIKQNQDSTGGIIRANKAGIGLSTDGGVTYQTAITFSGINANCINTGKVKAEYIETEKLIVSIGNVEISEDVSLNDYFKTENDFTYIDGGKIYTGSILADSIAANAVTADKIAAGAITAEKVNVGWQSGNCATGWTFESSYFTISSDSENEYNPKVYMKADYTSGNQDVDGKPFYASAGDVLKYGGKVYKTAAGDNGLYLKYSSTSDGSYSVVSYKNTSGDSIGAVHTKEQTYTVQNAGWYKLVVAFNKQTAGAYVTDVYCYRSVKGDMVVNGKISSVDGYTYFDLDAAEIVAKDSSGFSTYLVDGGIKSYYNSTEVGGLQPRAITGITNGAEVLWFNTGLQIGAGEPANNDSYLKFYSNKIESTKPMEFLAGSGGIKFYDTGANVIEMHSDSTSALKPCLRTKCRIFEVYNTSYPSIRFNNGSTTAEIYLMDGYLYVSDAGGTRKIS